MLSIIVFTPFISALLLALIYLSNTSAQRYILVTTLGVGSILATSTLSLLTLFAMLNGAPTIHTTAFQWLSLGEFHIEIAFMADRLSVVMISFITFIGLLIHIYAAGYMKDDAGYGKFFSYFNLFMGSMLLLVLADNPIIMFVGWELVGLSSYLLIGFYHTNTHNISAANKAFILNRIGDFGFIMGLALLFLSLEGTGFTFGAIKENISLIDHDRLSLIGILFFVGAMGKSAQIPLYVWLPDAMAGPTPVSALIHAATMVTAGVYMVARFSFLYIQIPDIGFYIASIGAASALFGAIIASYQTDIKKILAYSTMSQLGYMFIAVGLGAYSAGIFHVFTHAFFKALLFMGAGAVIVAMHHEQNIFKMGGLDQKLKLIYVTMFIATLTISGIPPFAGFFSKDAILVTAFANGYYVLWAIGTLTAALTAFYMFRMFFSVFYTDKHPTQKLHSVSRSMQYPLVILALGSMSVGFLGRGEAYGGTNLFGNFLALQDLVPHLPHETEYIIASLNTSLGIISMLVAYKTFAFAQCPPKTDNFFKRLLINKFYIDELYTSLFLKPLLFISKLSHSTFEKKVFDSFINATIWSYFSAANIFIKLQNGKVRYYALYIVTGVSLISLFLLYKLGENI